MLRERLNKMMLGEGAIKQRVASLIFEKGAFGCEFHNAETPEKTGFEFNCRVRRGRALSPFRHLSAGFTTTRIDSRIAGVK